MKVGIIGLQPRQIRDVSSREFNGHEIEFYSEKTHTQEKIASFVRKMDKVILLPGHVPKRVDEWIVKTKLHTMAGGMSSVVRYLSTLPHDTVAEPVRPLGTPKQVAAEVTEPVVEVKAPKKLGSTIPKGRQSQYTWSPDIGVVHPDESGEHRYDLLDAAMAGDVLRMARPKGVEYQVWRTRITSMRYNREQKKNQLLEAHYYEEYVDLLVVDPNPEATKATATEEPALGRGDIMAAAGVHVVEASPAPPPAETPAIHPALLPGPPAVVVNDLERDFWMKTFLAYADRLAPYQCAEFADTAVDLLKQRYKK